jgi:hypothetical protein
MTPKEKAEELLHNFCVNVLDEFEPSNGISRHKAKQCALIAVEEILSMGIMSDSGDWKMAKLYWQEVKKEIENLKTK